MRIRSLCLASLAGLGLLAAVGCKPSTSAPPPAAPPPPPAETVARLHWLGKKRLAMETNAAFLMKVWDLPASARLGDQTLDKLSTAPWRLLSASSEETNSASALLRPLLDDLANEEVYLEVRQPGNLPGELALAVHLDDQQAELWRTNLAAVLESLSGGRLVATSAPPLGWSLVGTNPPASAQLTRTGQWTLLGWGNDPAGLLADFANRIKSDPDHGPAPAGGTNFWIEADFDLARVNTALGLGLHLSTPSPTCYFSAIGDADNVRVRGHLDFPASQAPLVDLHPWSIPTNLVLEPIISFTAAQGVWPLLQKIEPFSDLHLKSPPDEFCVWGLFGMPFEEYFVARVEDGSNTFSEAVPPLIDWGKRWLPTNCGAFAMETNGSLVWTGMMAFTPPFILPVREVDHDYILGGLYPLVTAGKQAPGSLFAQILGRTNLVYYDWEVTQEKLKQWRFLDDTRFLFLDPTHRPHLRGDSAAIHWLEALTNLGNCVTEITLTGTNQLSFVRKAPLGLTALEFDTLANWVQSLDFPQFGFIFPPWTNGLVPANKPNPKSAH